MTRRHVEVRHPVLASVYDGFMCPQERLLGIGRQRRRLVEEVQGRVVEIGFGTGLNLPHYPPVEQLVAVEPDPHMRRRAAKRLASVELPFPVELLDAPAEQLPLPDGTADTVVACLVFCTIGDVRVALAEVRRVLAPDGRLLLLEHVRSDIPVVTWFQHAATPLWRNLAGGCHLDRRTVVEVEAAGFTFEHLWRSGDGRGSFVQGRARAATD